MLDVLLASADVVPRRCMLPANNGMYISALLFTGLHAALAVASKQLAMVRTSQRGTTCANMDSGVVRGASEDVCVVGLAKASVRRPRR